MSKVTQEVQSSSFSLRLPSSNLKVVL
jgi:hypothetical protein